jgi:site-specific recombinase XerD
MIFNLQKIVARSKMREGKRKYYVTMPRDLYSGEESKTKWFGTSESKANAFAESLNSLRQQRDDQIRGHARMMNGLAAFAAAHMIRDVRMRPEDKHIKPMKMVLQEFLAIKQKAGVSEKRLVTLRNNLEPFCDHCEKKQPMEITKNDIEVYIYANNGWSQRTRKDRIVDIGTLFVFCIGEQYVVKNPCEFVQRPKIAQAIHRVWSFQEVKLLLETALRMFPDVLGYICPTLYGGLRPQESERLTEEDFGKKYISLDGNRTKRRRIRNVQISDTLRAWLSVPGVALVNKGGNHKVHLIRRKIKETTGQEFPWDHDIMRHTFCSYAVHKFGFMQTSVMACTSEQNLRTIYFTLIQDEQEVEDFWNFRPDLTLLNTATIPFRGRGRPVAIETEISQQIASNRDSNWLDNLPDSDSVPLTPEARLKA